MIQQNGFDNPFQTVPSNFKSLSKIVLSVYGF